MGDDIPPARRFKTELTDYAVAHDDAPGPYARDAEYDAVIVGAGFGPFTTCPRSCLRFMV